MPGIGISAILTAAVLMGLIPPNATAKIAEVANPLLGVPEEAAIRQGLAGVEEYPRALQPPATTDVEVLRQAAREGDVDKQLSLYLLHMEGGAGLERDPRTALSWLRKAARTRDPFALDELGRLYLLGDTVQQDLEKARELFREAAKEGAVWAHTRLGLMYAVGLGGVADPEVAMREFRIAAEQGEPTAANELGVLLLRRGDVDEALTWYRKAADQELGFAMYNLGALTERGRDGPIDWGSLHRLYLAAAGQGVVPAMRALARIHLGGHYGAPDLEKAREWGLRAYMAGDGEAAVILALVPPAPGEVLENDSITSALISGFERGDPWGKIGLGLRQLTFDNTGANAAEAVEQIEQAARGGHVTAQFILGDYLGRSGADSASLKEAAEWHRRAAAQGHLVAKLRLAHMYREGRGVTQDLSRFLALVREVAETGDQTARFDIAAAYRNGAGVARDLYEALRRLAVLAEEGMLMAQHELASIYARSDSGATDPDWARQWLARLVQSDHAFYLEHAADLYADVLGDYVAALPLYQRAIEAGRPGAMNSLGIMYKRGRGVAQDWKKAVAFYRRAAELGDRDGLNNYGYALMTGEGVARNYREARLWLERAARKGSSLAELNLGHLYYHGLGVALDYKRAREWWDKAAAHGEVGAFQNLGLIYYNGQGVVRDRAKGIALFEKAAAHGDTNAVETLAEIRAQQAVPEPADAEQDVWELIFQGGSH